MSFLIKIIAFNLTQIFLFISFLNENVYYIDVNSQNMRT